MHWVVRETTQFSWPKCFIAMGSFSSSWVSTIPFYLLRTETVIIPHQAISGMTSLLDMLPAIWLIDISVSSGLDELCPGYCRTCKSPFKCLSIPPSNACSRYTWWILASCAQYLIETWWSGSPTKLACSCNWALSITIVSRMLMNLREADLVMKGEYDDSDTALNAWVNVE